MTTLQRRYADGTWIPLAEEPQLAGQLARLPWMEETIRAAKREAPSGTECLTVLLDNPAFVLRCTDARDPAVLPLRALADVLADDADRQPTPSAER
ncbi:hypothetical protein [Streptomyces shenzhenensis]|uniref:hypothetical protein n=1 Tax=Streptomyces shenzhenensis TaxID=943815 RepID=UPI0015EFFA8E|nr:hypothetical protein [Streptomyces shenzhenensis]